MTWAKRAWLIALVEGRVCTACGQGIVSPAMLAWTSECDPCRLRRVDREAMMGGLQ